jgi:hypothetical protein
MGKESKVGEESLEEVRKRHDKEIEEFIENCPHVDIVVEDYSFYPHRDITLRCKRCGLNVVGYHIDPPQSYLGYVRDCVAKYPGNIANIEGSSYSKNKK